MRRLRQRRRGEGRGQLLLQDRLHRPPGGVAVPPIWWSKFCEEAWEGWVPENRNGTGDQASRPATLRGRSRRGRERGRRDPRQRAAAGVCTGHTTVRWLKFVDFVPVSDQLIKGKLKDECKKALGLELIAETIDGNGIQARTTSAIRSGSAGEMRRQQPFFE